MSHPKIKVDYKGHNYACEECGVGIDHEKEVFFFDKRRDELHIFCGWVCLRDWLTTVPIQERRNREPCAMR